jgi:hypothetical protein
VTAALSLQSVELQHRRKRLHLIARSPIKRSAREALRRLKSGQTYEDWRAVGQQMMVITEEVINELALEEWDPDNKQLTREFTRRFEGWEAGVSNAKPISKQERWALRELMTDPKYHAFYTTELAGPEQRKTNHPNKIIEKYKRKIGSSASPARALNWCRSARALAASHAMKHGTI